MPGIYRTEAGSAKSLYYHLPLPPGSKTLADAVEAVIGAAYLDGSYEAARVVFQGLELTAKADLPEWSANPKGELQVRSQAMQPPRRPEYVLLKTEGKAHEPIFTVKVTVDGVEVRGGANALRAAGVVVEGDGRVQCGDPLGLTVIIK